MHQLVHCLAVYKDKFQFFDNFSTLVGIRHALDSVGIFLPDQAIFLIQALSKRLQEFY